MYRLLATVGLVWWLSTIALALDVADPYGLKHVRPGAKCQVKKETLAGRALGDLQRSERIMRSGDEKAWLQLYDQGIVFDLSAMTVFVEAVQGRTLPELPEYAQVRPQGRVDTMWISVYALKCGEE